MLYIIHKRDSYSGGSDFSLCDFFTMPLFLVPNFIYYITFPLFLVVSDFLHAPPFLIPYFTLPLFLNFFYLAKPNSLTVPHFLLSHAPLFLVPHFTLPLFHTSTFPLSYFSIVQLFLVQVCHFSSFFYLAKPIFLTITKKS